jgi:C_GCAxxG_C_C family probable redox protein
MTKGDIAVENFKTGMNCCQAVVLAFKDEINVSEDMLKKLSIGFGGGLGRQRLTCGAVSGMCMVISALKSDGADKLAVYSLIQQACAQFKEQTGSLICAELLDAQSASDTNPKPEDRTEAYYKKRPCSEMCRLAADIAHNFIK